MLDTRPFEEKEAEAYGFIRPGHHVSHFVRSTDGQKSVIDCIRCGATGTIWKDGDTVGFIFVVTCEEARNSPEIRAAMRAA